MTATHPTFRSGPAHAEAYANMAHHPARREVRESYTALSIAIVSQWMGLRTAGFQFEASTEDPYDSSGAMFGAANDGGITVFADCGASLPFDHPMRLSPVAFGADIGTVNEGFVTLNDVFRGVHDIMGHWRAWKAGKCASFGPVGEYNAWRSHWETLPAEAHLALWCETRGQNAWTNFYGDHAELPISERPYVDQRAGVPELPLWSLLRIITPEKN